MPTNEDDVRTAERPKAAAFQQNDNSAAQLFKEASSSRDNTSTLRPIDVRRAEVDTTTKAFLEATKFELTDGRHGNPISKKALSDASARPVAAGSDRLANQDAQRESLRRTANKLITNPFERAEYERNIDRFDAASKKAHHSPKEVAEFYRQSERLLKTPSSLVKQADRIRLAQDAIKQAIRPTIIDQGPYNTCNAATVEVNMYSRQPSKALKAVADAALTGHFRTADGSVIKVPKNTLQPKEALPGTGARSFASQIFQDLAINTHWQRASNGDLRYSHGFRREFQGDTGQRLWNERERRFRTDGYGHKINSPGLCVGDLPGIYKQMAGTRPDVLGIERRPEGSAPSHQGIKSVHRMSDLHDALAKLARSDKGFPVIMMVHTGHEPFRTDSGYGAAGGSGGWHVVTATGYDVAKRRVSIDNTWGKSRDHSGSPGELKTVPLGRLFNSMAAPRRRR